MRSVSLKIFLDQNDENDLNWSATEVKSFGAWTVILRLANGGGGVGLGVMCPVAGAALACLLGLLVSCPGLMCTKRVDQRSCRSPNCVQRKHICLAKAKLIACLIIKVHGQFSILYWETKVQDNRKMAISSLSAEITHLLCKGETCVWLQKVVLMGSCNFCMAARAVNSGPHRSFPPTVFCPRVESSFFGWKTNLLCVIANKRNQTEFHFRWIRWDLAQAFGARWSALHWFAIGPSLNETSGQMPRHFFKCTKSTLPPRPKSHATSDARQRQQLQFQWRFVFSLFG